MPSRERPRGRNLVRLAILLVSAVLALLHGAPTASALDPIEVDTTSDRITLTAPDLHQRRSGSAVQIETAPGMDGITGRMTVNTSIPGAEPDWIVFALRNTGDRSLTFWLTAERYTLIGSGITWPDLDTKRITNVTPSVGFVPERVENDRADIFQLTIDPGNTITYAVERASAHATEISLWQPTSYRLKTRDRQLINGVMLGIVGVLGVFLTSVFAANHKLIFPAASMVAWSVLAYLCVDFGFWHKLFQLSPEDNAAYRAATEAAMAASLLIFLYSFLRLGSWGGFVRMLFSVWIIVQLGLVAIALIDPKLAATFARLSFAAIAGVGLLLITWLSIRGQDRALSLASGWLLFSVWVFGAAMSLVGRLHGELVVTSHVAGLVLVTVLFGFIVMQFAFTGSEPSAGGHAEDLSTRGLAVEGAGAAVWEWRARRDEVSVSETVDAMLGLDLGTLSAKLDGFCAHMHPSDRERFLAALATVKENNGGTIRQEFRMRHSGNYYRWFQLEAANVRTTDPRALRCCGLLRDISDEKRTNELLLHDAVHDSLTGLPNRELFLDRLDRELAQAGGEVDRAPVVMIVDLDRFRTVNTSYGFVVGDSLLLTMARRLKSHLQAMETVARIGGNQFGLIVHRSDPNALYRLAEDLRRSIRAPSQVAGQEVVLTGAVGVAVVDPVNDTARTALNAAEIATLRAKRSGVDSFEIFKPEMRSAGDDRTRLRAELAAAIEAGQLSVVYQPIVYLPTEDLSGFEALVRWRHPTLGMLNAVDFVPIAEESDLIDRLGAFVLWAAARESARWQKILPRDDHPLFVSVNVSSRQLLAPSLAQQVRRVLSEVALPTNGLRLELTESLVMDNPEQATQMLGSLREAGAKLAIDDFGTGYSSLAYLQRFPFDTVKIDRELVQASADGEKGGAIVRSIVALAHELGKTIVAEGVETPEDYAFLRSLGCEYGQGFYYGEPMGANDVVDLLKVVRRAERRFQRRIFGQKKPAAIEAPKRAKAPAPEPETAQQQGAQGNPKVLARPPEHPQIPGPYTRDNQRMPAATAPAAKARAVAAARPDAPNGPGGPPPQARPAQAPANRATPPLPTPGPGQKAPPPGARGAQPSAASKTPPPPLPGASRPPEHTGPPTQPVHRRPSQARRPTPDTRPSDSAEEVDLIAALGEATQPSSAHAGTAPGDSARAAERGWNGARGNGANGARSANATNGSHPADPDALAVDSLKTLPPGIARSLAKLAGVELDEGADGENGATPNGAGPRAENGHAPAKRPSGPPPLQGRASDTTSPAEQAKPLGPDLLSRFRKVGGGKG